MEFTEEEKQILYKKYKKEGMTEDEVVESIKLLIAIPVSNKPNII